jgi:hypothetical protein
MSASNAFEAGLLALILKNVPLPGVGDVAGLLGSAGAGSLYVSLHTADPGEGGDQSTNEASFLGYGRLSVARSAAGWDVSGSVALNAASLTFGANNGLTTVRLTHFGIGTAPTGAGVLLLSGAFDAPVDVPPGGVTQIGPGALIVTAD